MISATCFGFTKPSSGQYLRYGSTFSMGTAVLCYKSEGPWFDPSWYHWIFH